jgi:hypothetical protein
MTRPRGTISKTNFTKKNMIVFFFKILVVLYKHTYVNENFIVPNSVVLAFWDLFGYLVLDFAI